MLEFIHNVRFLRYSDLKNENNEEIGHYG